MSVWMTAESSQSPHPTPPLACCPGTDQEVPVVGRHPEGKGSEVARILAWASAFSDPAA